MQAHVEVRRADRMGRARVIRWLGMPHLDAPALANALADGGMAPSLARMPGAYVQVRCDWHVHTDRRHAAMLRAICAAEIDCAAACQIIFKLQAIS